MQQIVIFCSSNNNVERYLCPDGEGGKTSTYISFIDINSVYGFITITICVVYNSQEKKEHIGHYSLTAALGEPLQRII